MFGFLAQWWYHFGKGGRRERCPFASGAKETDYLSCKDKRLAAAIAQIGPIEREVDTDLFAAVVHHIIGQQISMKAQATIWQRMRDALGTVDAEHLLAAGVPQLQQLGMTFRKAEYITDFSQKIHDGTFDLQAVWQMPDDEAIRALSSLKGIGVWTAEMILLFCMQRARCVQLRRFSDTARFADAVPSPKH